MRPTVRIAAALAVWAAGAVHLYLWEAEGYRSIPTIGTLFLLNGMAAAAIGLALIVSAHPLVLITGMGYAATTLVAFAISATSGLFGWKEVWAGAAQEAAGIAELAAIGFQLTLLVRRRKELLRPGRGQPKSRREPLAPRV